MKKLKVAVLFLFFIPCLPLHAQTPYSKDSPATPPSNKFKQYVSPRQVVVDFVDVGASLKPYMADLQRRIKRSWFPPKGSLDKNIIIVFKIHEDGSVSDLHLRQSSGSEIADQAALKAVENAKPRPLPAKKIVDVEITLGRTIVIRFPNFPSINELSSPLFGTPIQPN